MTASTGTAAAPRTTGGDAQSDAERFVIAAVRAYATGERCPAPPDAGPWVELATNAGVLATVADAVEAANHPVPTEVHAERLRAAATSMRTTVELRALTAALDGVPWLVIKGPVLADTVYRTASSRTYDDVDVLVHPHHLGAALDGLAAGGFTLVDRNWPKIAEMQRGEISLRGRTGTNIDLHWHPINDVHTRVALPVDVDGMIRRSIEVQLGGVTVRTLCPADTVVYVALHAGLSGGHRLKWLLDIQQAVRWSGCTPAEIAWRARTHGLGLVVRTMLDRVVMHVDPSLAPFAEELSAGPLWAAACRRISRQELPLPGRTGRHSGRSVFAATRRTSVASARRLLADLARDARDRATHRDADAELEALMSPHDSAADRAAWVAAAAGHRP